MAHRVFKDSIGRRWEVWSVIPSRVERRRAAERAEPPTDGDRRRESEYRVPLGEQWAKGWLTFETKGEKRRLAAYPEAWLDMTDEELEELCRLGTLISPSRRLIE